MNGILVIDKPTGITSQVVINQVRRSTGMKKVGHCGTLDPLASGVLPIMLGSATKACELLMDHQKSYTATMQLGIKTDSEDITGAVIDRFSGDLPTFEDFSKVALSFQGEILQTPPMYSALKKDGKKLVDLARKGVTVEREPRKVTIHSIRPYQKDGLFCLDVLCSRGTYIRTLCADIGEQLGCGACMTSLRRNAVGVFSIEESIPLSQLREMTQEQIEHQLKSVSEVFADLPSVRLPAFYNRLFRNGEKISLNKLKSISGSVGSRFRIFDENGFYAIAEIVFQEDELKLATHTYFA